MLKIENLSYTFPGQKHPILQHLDLEVLPGEILALAGGSGTGKTTLLRLIAGLESPQTGEVFLEGDRAHPLPEYRGMALMFQDLALFPHLTVKGNALFGAKTPSHRQSALELLNQVGLQNLEDRYPHQLSGGQRQRLAWVRALAAHPRILLLDEPFNNLDRNLIEEMGAQLRRLLKAQGIPAILVTHDRLQAFTLGDRVGFLEAGRVVQLASPDQFYRHPKTLKAGVFGGPGNLADLTKAEARALFPRALQGARWAFLRPEDLQEGAGSGAPILVRERIFAGREWHLSLEIPWSEDPWMVYSPTPKTHLTGLEWDEDRVVYWEASPKV